MLLKTKDRCGKLDAEAGMFMKTQVLSPLEPECLRKQKGLTLVTARGEWRLQTMCPGHRLGVRQRDHRIKAADLKNGGPRYPTFHTGRQFEKNSFFERTMRECR